MAFKGRGRTKRKNGRKKKTFFRKKVCRLCENKMRTAEYKDVKFLRNFITERGKIIPGRISGNCAPHQRSLTEAIKRARNIALLPFAEN